MKTTIYLIRHSEPLKGINHFSNRDCLQVKNEKNPLSVNGERKAFMLSECEEFSNIDLVISSNYVRAISTAKYIALKNDRDLCIIEDFGERKHGVNAWGELPEGFEKLQLEDADYKIGNGESQKEVASRMYNALMEVLNNNGGKRIAIVTHATAMMFLFIKIGEYREGSIYFKSKVVIDRDFEWNAPEVFKLTFEDEELSNIENIKC